MTKLIKLDDNEACTLIRLLRYSGLITLQVTLTMALVLPSEIIEN